MAWDSALVLFGLATAEDPLPLADEAPAKVANYSPLSRNGRATEGREESGLQAY